MPRYDAKGRKIAELVCDSATFADWLMVRCDWFCAVPDSVIRLTLPHLSPMQFAPRENHAVGAAFGAALGGGRPCVLLQNSGLGLCLDAVLGLFRLYGQGLVLVVSNRGELTWEEVQHQDWGRITVPLLDAAAIPWFDFERMGREAVDAAADRAWKQGEVAAILVHRGNLDEQA
jgi:phosphonopyruvate decarboxylase